MPFKKFISPKKIHENFHQLIKMKSINLKTWARLQNVAQFLSDKLMILAQIIP